MLHCKSSGYRGQGIEVATASGHGVHLQLRRAALPFISLILPLSFGCHHGGGKRCVDARAAAQSQTILPLRGVYFHPCIKFYLHEISVHHQNINQQTMDSEDPLFILYTSGSTGKPKGVMHTTAGYGTRAEKYLSNRRYKRFLIIVNRYILNAALTTHRTFDLKVSLTDCLFSGAMNDHI